MDFRSQSIGRNMPAETDHRRSHPLKDFRIDFIHLLFRFNACIPGPLACGSAVYNKKAHAFADTRLSLFQKLSESTEFLAHHIGLIHSTNTLRAVDHKNVAGLSDDGSGDLTSIKKSDHFKLVVVTLDFFLVFQISLRC